MTRNRVRRATPIGAGPRGHPVRERLFRVLLSCALCFAVPAPAAEIKTDADAKWVEDAGGTVIRDPAGRITGVDLHASWVTDTDLRKLTQLPYLSSLDLSLTRITDQGMLELKNV